MIKSKSDLVLSKNLRTISRLTTTPDGWKVIRIQEGFDLGRGRVINQDEIDTNPGIYPVFSSQTHNNGQMGLINSFDYDGEFLTWTTDGANAGTVFYRMGKFNCTNVCGTLKAKPGYCAKFFLYYLNTIAKYYVSYVGNPKLMNDVMGNIVLTSPPYSIQCRIADILSTTDDVIKKTEAVIDKYQAIKAGMMQDLFTRGIDTITGMLRPTIEEAPELYKESELGWIPKGWEIVQIGDFAKIKGGKRMPAGKEFSDALTPFPYLRVTDMQHGSIDQSDLKYVPVEIEPLIRSYKISVEDVYVTIAGTLGLFGTIPVNLDQAQLTENAARITEFDKLEYDRDFIKHQCNSTIVQGQVIREIGVGGGVPKLALYRIAKFLFLKPAIHEQQVIVERIRIIEHQLIEESVALTKYKQLKQGMMADLLTGKVRVNLNKNKMENG